jgi:hypothetical protein
MRFKVKLQALVNCYADVYIDADSEEEAMAIAEDLAVDGDPAFDWVADYDTVEDVNAYDAFTVGAIEDDEDF